MENQLPTRPNLDHLRRQAKSLLAAVGAGDTQAISILKDCLPAAAGMTADQIQSAGFRLADAQAAIARKNGFSAWPHLARHVEQLRALEGTWSFTRLEVDGTTLPAAALAASRILIDGDRFRTESPETTYEGVFNINVETESHEIDIEFVAGPEAGNWNYGIFRMDDARLEICLDLNGSPRPLVFAAPSGSGRAYEILSQTSTVRPENVTGGSSNPDQSPTSSLLTADDFMFVDSPTLARLQGEWKAIKIVRDGQSLPTMMLRTGLRTATKNEVSIAFSGQTMIHALVRLNADADPVHIDYYNLSGPLKGTVQLGLLKWNGDDACFCMAAPGEPRPADFICTHGTGCTYSEWRHEK